MVIEKRKILLYLISAIAILAIGGFLLYYYRDAIKNKFVKTFNKEAFSGLPGALIGPKRATRAQSLDPARVIYWTNYYRKQNGLGELKVNALLTTAAQKKVDDMFTNQYFEHVSPSGVSPSELVSSVGYNYKVTGENLALGDFTSEKDLVDAWMNSPGHRANILNKDYTEIGVATGLGKFEDRSSTWLAVQEFAKPLPNCTKPDINLQNTINSQKAELESLNSQIANLNTEAQSLNEQGNQNIQKGNEIYASTHDQSQAQPYWDKGTLLQNQAKEDLTQAQTLQSQAQVLSNTINSESNQYNSQVNKYNACISQ